VAFILRSNFVMQSNLLKKLDVGGLFNAAMGKLNREMAKASALPWGPVTTTRLLRTVLLYACVYLTAATLIAFTETDSIAAFATGLIAPGTGFLFWANPAGEAQWFFLGLYALAVAAFAVGMVLWFATGNIIAPVFMWLASAIVAAQVSPAELITSMLTSIEPGAAMAWPFISQLLLLIAPLSIVFGFVVRVDLARKQAARYARFCEDKPVSVVFADTRSKPSELSKSDLQLMRALLDRSLQPVEEFKGFDWLDQFQTAALRYQINFVSYALSVSSQVQLPAAQAYMQKAQVNLAAKLLDPRVWGYWKLENIWGNFATSADPIPRDNIMLSGFLAAQFGLARRLVAMHHYDGRDGVVFRTRAGQEFRYSLTEISEILKEQYLRAPMGLLACEPNWVFPLCNSITALGMRSLDTQLGTSYWDDIAGRFDHALETEFTSPGGLFVPFRSSRTGIAPPLIGGGAMQTFPCLFLNALLPEAAARQWSLARENLTEANGRRALWPVDIGNYRFNRSASIGACAAVAAEMGDTEITSRLLNYLDEDYPCKVDAGVAHRPGVSLWSHALEFTARAGRANALRDATLTRATNGPVIAEADYPDVLLASATNTEDSLQAVLYPGNAAGEKSITIGGLKPTQVYRVNADRSYKVQADHQGRADISVEVNDRSCISITPVT
jgi:hypothetical protein